MLVGDIVRNNSRLLPNKMGIIDGEKKFTWRELNTRVNRLANAMLSFGYSKGERVAIISENCHQYLEFLFAAAKSGLISVTLNYRLSPDQIIPIINDCEPKMLLVEDKFKNNIEPVASTSKFLHEIIGIGDEHGCDYDYETLIGNNSSREPGIEISDDDLHRIQYTTGTTGKPKGAMLTHKNTIANCIWRAIVPVGPGSRDDIVLEWMPFFAAGGQGKIMGHCFRGCTTVVCTFSAQTFLELCEKEKVTFTTLTYPAFRIIKEFMKKSDRNYDLSSLKFLAMAGGSKFLPEQVKEMLDYFNISYDKTVIGYAMTETAVTGTCQLPEHIAASLSPDATEKEKKRLASVGTPVIFGEMKVVDENDNDVPPGVQGEILLKNDGVMEGYWRKPNLTKKVLQNGWYRTSDIGKLDEDGNLYITGRKDFLIKSGGFFVSPEEVEEALQRHPAVSEAAVIPIPDEKWGQVLKALVCLRPGETATADEITEYCRSKLANYQAPRVVEFRDKLPREVATNKIVRKKLK